VNGLLLATTICWLASLAMGLYVGLRRDKQTFHWLLCGICVSLTIWLSGSIVRQTVPTPEGLRIAIPLIYTGVFTAPPLWLLLAAHHARSWPLGSMHALALIAVIPSALFLLALLTNDGHRLLLREFSLAAMDRGPSAFAGPLFWVFVTWAFACVMAGVGFFVASVRSLPPGPERRRAALLALGALLPLATGSVYLLQPVAMRIDITPFAFTASTAFFYVALFRYRLLESLPLAREEVLAHLEDGVLLADAGGRVVAQNPAALRILGAQGDALRGRPLAEVLARLAAIGEAAAPPLALPDGAAHEAMEIETASGRYIEVSGGLLRDSGGDRLGRFAMLRDRTEERRYERRMRQIQKLETVGALAAGIAREVNDPLTFVRSNLGEIQRLGERVAELGKSGREAELAEALRDLVPLAEEARAGVDRIARLVGDMRTLFRGATAGVEAVDVSAVVDDALRGADLARPDGPNVVVSEEGRLLPLRGSAERLTQAVGALLANARQALAGSSDPVIRIALRRDAGWIELEVSDNGPGVPEHLRERVFDPFFTTKSPDQGTGLGLSLAFDIAREHGGLLEERSLRGRGATFVMRLPALEVARAGAAPLN
jgi:PAS domain S-box-containing protein